MRFKDRSLIGQAPVELAILGTLILFAFSVLLIYGQRLNATQRLKMEVFRKAMERAYKKNSSVSYTIKKDARIADLFSGMQGQRSSTSASATVMWVKGLPGKQDKENEQNLPYYEVNGREIDFRQIWQAMGSPEKTVVSEAGLSSDIPALPSISRVAAIERRLSQETSSKNEAADNIANSRDSNLEEAIITDFYLHYEGEEIQKINGACPGDTDSKAGKCVYDARKPSLNQVPVYIDANNTASPINITQQAYLGDDGHINYKESNAAEKVHESRTWTTAH
jgi:hypothetical protein